MIEIREPLVRNLGMPSLGPDTAIPAVAGRHLTKHLKSRTPGRSRVELPHRYPECLQKPRHAFARLCTIPICLAACSYAFNDVPDWCASSSTSEANLRHSFIGTRCCTTINAQSACSRLCSHMVFVVMIRAHTLRVYLVWTTKYRAETTV